MAVLTTGLPGNSLIIVILKMKKKHQLEIQGEVCSNDRDVHHVDCMLMLPAIEVLKDIQALKRKP